MANYCCASCKNEFLKHKESWKEYNVDTPSKGRILFLHDHCNFKGLPMEIQNEYYKMIEIQHPTYKMFDPNRFQVPARNKSRFSSFFQEIRHQNAAEQPQQLNYANVARKAKDLPAPKPTQNARANPRLQQTSARCDTFFNPRTCTRCGEPDHTFRNCDKIDVLCERCGNPGHIAKVCKTKICERCKKKGHLVEQCKVQWCEQCKVFGHSTEGCWKNIECHRCLRKGHPEHRCYAIEWCNLCFTINSRVSRKRGTGKDKIRALCSHFPGRCERRSLICDRCGDIGHCETECISKICEHCDKRGHTTDECFHNQWCLKCHKRGHKHQYCRSKEWCYFCFDTRKSDFTGVCADDSKLVQFCSHYPGFCAELADAECNFCGEAGHLVPYCGSSYKLIK